MDSLLKPRAFVARKIIALDRDTTFSGSNFTEEIALEEKAEKNFCGKRPSPQPIKFITREKKCQPLSIKELEEHGIQVKQRLMSYQIGEGIEVMQKHASKLS